MLKKLALIFTILFSWFFSYFSFADALDDAYENATDYQIVDEDISDNSSKVSNWVQDTAKLLLRISIIIWVAVFLYGGIRFLLSMWDDSKAKKVRDSLITAAIGLIIAFGAWTILQLIVSVWKTIQV